MEVMVLVCALTVAAPDCQAETSVHSFYAPEPQLTLAGCLRDGLFYAAESGLVTSGTYPKVLCIPPRTDRVQTSERTASEPD